MKRLKIFIVMAICMFCLSGCMRYDLTFEFKNNKTMKINYVMAVPEGNGVVDMTDIIFFKNNAKQDGWEVTDYSRDGYMGICLYKKLPFDEAFTDDVPGGSDGEDGDSGDDGDDLNELKTLRFTPQGDKYTLTWDMYADFERIAGGNGLEEVTMEEFLKQMEDENGSAYFTVKIPRKALNHDAHNVSDNGKVYQWDLRKLGPGETIKIQFELKDNTPLYIRIAIIAAIVILVIGLIVGGIFLVRHLKAKKIKKEQMDQALYQIQDIYYKDGEQ